MNLSFQKNDLGYPLQVIQNIAHPRNSLPILSHVLIKASDDNIECVATDLEIGIRMKVEGSIEEEGSIAVSAKKLADIVKELPEDQNIHLQTTANDRLELRCGTGIYKIIGLPSDQFPSIPAVDSDPITLDGYTLRSIIRRTAFAADTDSIAFNLNGLYFYMNEDKIEVVASDRSKLALTRQGSFETPENLKEFIVPLKSVREIERAFANTQELNLSVFENHILFADKKTTFTARLVEGEYLSYNSIIPESMEGSAIVLREDILSAAKRVSLLSNPKSFAISVEVHPDKIELSSETPDLGEANETVAANEVNGNIRFGIDARYFIEILQHIESEHIQIQFQDAESLVMIEPVKAIVADDEETDVASIVFKPIEAYTHLCIVMPMRLPS